MTWSLMVKNVQFVLEVLIISVQTKAISIDL